MKFQKAVTLLWNGGASKTWSQRQQIKVWENTKHLHKRKNDKYGMMK